MNSTGFPELDEHFMTKVSDLQKMIDIKLTLRDDSEYLEQVQSFESEVDNVQNTLSVFRRDIQTEKEKVTKLQETNSQLEKFLTHLTYLVNNTPERLPRHQDSEPPGADKGAGDTTQTNQKTAKSTSANQKPSLKTSPPTATSQAISGKQPNTYYPEIEYLKVDEFQDVPKYLKGRITYDQMNKFIDGMNAAYLSKYKLLRQKKSSLNDANRKRYEIYKSQETKDTAGSYFVTEDDLRDYGSLKIDNVARSIKTILRHCKRIREVRGGKITRIVYIDNY